MKRVPQCFYCGELLCWDSDFDASEVYPLSYDEDEYATMSMYHCPNCGRIYEILDPTEEGEKAYYSKFWEE